MRTIEDVQQEQQAVADRHSQLQAELKQLEARWHYLQGQEELLRAPAEDEA